MPRKQCKFPYHTCPHDQLGNNKFFRVTLINYKVRYWGYINLLRILWQVKMYILLDVYSTWNFPQFVHNFDVDGDTLKFHFYYLLTSTNYRQVMRTYEYKYLMLINVHLWVILSLLKLTMGKFVSPVGSIEVMVKSL